ncbi:MAG: cohesin domain-containing protein [Candidatus Eisenbacteria bacterium]
MSLLSKCSAPLLLAAVLSFVASTAGAAVLAIAPADTTVQVGATFTVRVTCDAVSDLKGLQTAWSYSPARLQYVTMFAGNVFSNAGGAWFEHVLPDVSAPADTAWLDAAMLSGSTSGPGVVAYLRFKALVPGDAPLVCAIAEIRDSHNVSLGPTCENGMVHVAAPTPALRRTWGHVKTHAW